MRNWGKKKYGFVLPSAESYVAGKCRRERRFMTVSLIVIRISTSLTQNLQSACDQDSIVRAIQPTL